MRLLLTGSTSKLGAALRRSLAREHDVVTLDLAERGGEPSPTYIGDPRDRELAARAAAGCAAIVHCPPFASEGASDVDTIDAATRGTYNLMIGATAATRFVLISSLRTFERYPMDWRVTEQWAPRPTTAV
jgi:nucleoside-diphosphate-sugar epimerase